MKPSRFLFVAFFTAAAAIAAVPPPAAAHDGDRDWGGHGWEGHGWDGGDGDWGGWNVGIGIGAVPGPYYYPPPVYYAPPPPVYYAPPPPPPPPPPGYFSPYPGFIQRAPSPVSQPAPLPGGPAGAAQSCDAGGYVCPMEMAVPPGARCYCRDNNGGRVYGAAQ